jgi:hypothetical protein
MRVESQLQWLFQGKVPDWRLESGLSRERPTLITGVGGTENLAPLKVLATRVPRISNQQIGMGEKFAQLVISAKAAKFNIAGRTQVE